MGTKGKAALIVSICAVAFTGGICAGFIRSRTKAEEPSVAEKLSGVEEASIVEPETELEMPTTARDYYLVNLKGDNIIIYEVYTNGTRSEIERCPVVKSALRREDVELLTEGIKAYSREEAIMMTEDFAS